MFRILFRILFRRKFVDTTELVTIEIKPTYIDQSENDLSPKLVTFASLFRFATSGKLDRNYIFGTGNSWTDWKFVVRKVFITKQKNIRYEIKFTSPKDRKNILLKDLKEKIATGFHRSTTSGDCLPLTTKKDDIFVIILSKNVTVFQSP